MKNKPKEIEKYLLGGAILALAWGSSTFLHELFHIIVARSLGINAEFGNLTISAGSIITYGEMTSLETTLVAMAGSFGLIIVGTILIRCENNLLAKMAGIIFLCRAWIDAIPICGTDGGLIAGSVGYVNAYVIVIAEVLICGGFILNALQQPKGL